MAKKQTAPQPAAALKYDLSGHIDEQAFELVGTDSTNMEAIARPSISFGKDAFNRLRRSPTAVVCMIILILLILGAIFLPVFSAFSVSQQNVAFANQHPMSIDTVTHNLHIFGTDALGRDIWVRTWAGARVSLTVAFAVALIDCAVGVLYGGIWRCCRQRDDAYCRNHQRHSLFDYRYASDDCYGPWPWQHYHCLLHYRVDRYGTSGTRTSYQPE